MVSPACSRVDSSHQGARGRDDVSVLKGRRRAADQEDFPPGEKEIRAESQAYKTEDHTAEEPGKVPWQRRSVSCCLQAVAPRRPGAEPLAF